MLVRRPCNDGYRSLKIGTQERGISGRRSKIAAEPQSHAEREAACYGSAAGTTVSERGLRLNICLFVTAPTIGDGDGIHAVTGDDRGFAILYTPRYVEHRRSGSASGENDRSEKYAVVGRHEIPFGIKTHFPQADPLGAVRFRPAGHVVDVANREECGPSRLYRNRRLKQKPVFGDEEFRKTGARNQPAVVQGWPLHACPAILVQVFCARCVRRRQAHERGAAICVYDLVIAIVVQPRIRIGANENAGAKSRRLSEKVHGEEISPRQNYVLNDP